MMITNATSVRMVIETGSVTAPEEGERTDTLPFWYAAIVRPDGTLRCNHCGKTLEMPGPRQKSSFTTCPFCGKQFMDLSVLPR